jgi:hypothetical protein
MTLDRDTGSVFGAWTAKRRLVLAYQLLIKRGQRAESTNLNQNHEHELVQAAFFIGDVLLGVRISHGCAIQQ